MSPGTANDGVTIFLPEKNDDLFSHCVTLTFAERKRLALSLSENNPLTAN